MQKILVFLSMAFLLVSCTAKSKLADVVEKLPPPAKNGTQPVDSSASDAGTSKILEDFFSETVGASPNSFVPVVGNWAIAVNDYNNLLKLDGSKSQQKQTASEIAEKLKPLYGDRANEFARAVENSAYFPLAIHKKVTDFKEGELSVNFQILGGESAQVAGIIFAVQPNGESLIIEVDTLKNTLTLFDYQAGKLRLIKEVKNIPTARQQWQYLKLIANGNQIEVFLNDERYLRYTLQKPVSGRVGLWSRGDSVIEFDNFKVGQQTSQ